METPDRYARKQHQARFRFYANLNDSFPGHTRQREFGWFFTGTATVKDTIESIGVPHPEVDVILVSGKLVDVAHPLAGLPPEAAGHDRRASAVRACAEPWLM